MQESAAPTSATTAHPEGQVVGNQIYYGSSTTARLCTCCASPLWDRKMRVLVSLTVFFFVFFMVNFICGILISGFIFFAFFLVLLVCLIIHYLRMKGAITRALTMQTATYHQVPAAQAQAYPGVQPYAPQAYPTQPYPNQQYSSQPQPSQPYPPQQYPTQPYYPSQPYPQQQYSQQSYPAAQPYPPAALPSDQVLSGEKQPLPQGGVPPGSTGDMPPPQPGGPSTSGVPLSSGPGPTAPPGDLPPPPSYSEVVHGSNT